MISFLIGCIFGVLYAYTFVRRTHLFIQANVDKKNPYSTAWSYFASELPRYTILCAALALVVYIPAIHILWFAGAAVVSFVAGVWFISGNMHEY